MTEFSLKLQRYVGQILFRPTVFSFEKTALIASNLEDSFEEWRATKSDDITLFSPSTKSFLNVKSDSLTYSVEDIKTEDNLLKGLNTYIEESFKTQTENNGVKVPRRVGSRLIQVFETDFEFSDLVDLIYRKFYSASEQIKLISGIDTKDVIFVLDSSRDGFLNHVRIGPVKKEEIALNLNGAFNSDVIFGNKGNLFIDVDVFSNQQDLDISNTIEKLNGALKQNFLITSEYLTYLTSTT